MKKDYLQQLKNKPNEELMKELKDSQEKLRVLKFDLAAGKIKNVREIRNSKETIAVILTLMNKDTEAERRG